MPSSSLDLRSNAAISRPQKPTDLAKSLKGLQSRSRRSKPAVSKSTKSGILFPVSRVLRLLRKSKVARVRRISASAAVYLAAVLEYMTCELLDLAGNVAKAGKRKLLTPRFIMIAATSDSEISKMLQKVTFPFSGVQPAILPQLLSRASSKVKQTGRRESPHASKTSEKTLRKLTLPNGRVLQVVQADMAELSVDAIVNPTSSNFYMGGMVGSRLTSKGGVQFAEVMRQTRQDLPILPYLAAHITDAPNLNAQHVIHVNGPTWDSGLVAERLRDLEQCVENCLRLASDKELASLAMPSIGSGRAGFPKAVAAETIVKTIKRLLGDNVLVSLRDVQFVLYDQESIDCYIYELNRTT
ncbi:hypothetical protein SprV_0301145800 [Sparganum proliferum]